MRHSCPHWARWLLVLATGCTALGSSAQPAHYNTLWLGSTTSGPVSGGAYGLQFPGGGQLPRAVPNPFGRRVAGPVNRYTYFTSAINDAGGQPLYGWEDATSLIQTRTVAGDSLLDPFLLGAGKVLVAPWPGKPRYYLLFRHHSPTLQPRNFPTLTYAVIDRRGNQGNGSIRLDSAQLLLHNQAPASDRPMALARHASGHGLWLLTVRRGEGFRAYRIDSTGVGTVPVVSRVGTAISASVDWNYRLLMSLNQRRLVVINRWSPPAMADDSASIEMFDFDDATGQVSRPRTVYGYGRGQRIDSLLLPKDLLVLSPQGRYAYGVVRGRADSLGYGVDMYQYDLWAGSPSAVYASRYRVHELPIPLRWTWFNVGPDGRLYAPRVSSEYVDVLDCPDAAGPSCGYRDSAVQVPQVQTIPSAAEQFPDILPTPYADILPLVDTNLGSSSHACVGQTTSFAFTQASAIDSVHWSFGDASAVVDGLAVQHTWTQVGTYRVEAVYYYRCASDTIRRTVTVGGATRHLLLTPDTVACGPVTLRVHVPVGVDTWAWTDGAAGPQRTVSTSGTYQLTWQSGTCRGQESVQVLIECQPLPNVVTPNGDGLNDAFVVDYGGKWRFRVYNRWGKLVWQSATDDYHHEWRGQGASSGTYYYHLQEIDGPRQYRGWVELVQ